MLTEKLRDFAEQAGFDVNVVNKEVSVSSNNSFFGTKSINVDEELEKFADIVINDLLLQLNRKFHKLDEELRNENVRLYVIPTIPPPENEAIYVR